MSVRKKENLVSRRTFVSGMLWAPLPFLPSPLQGLKFALAGKNVTSFGLGRPQFADIRVTPHYPAKSDLEDLFRQAAPGGDEYVTEKYALEIGTIFQAWSRNLKTAAPPLDLLAKFLDFEIEATSLTARQEINVRSRNGIEVLRRHFANQVSAGRDRFLAEMKAYLSSFAAIETAEFQIAGIRESTPGTVECEIRYDLVGTEANGSREQRLGSWLTNWAHNGVGWRALKWSPTGETVCRTKQKVFFDVTLAALGHAESYHTQMLYGADHWRTVLDAASGVDVYGNNGIAVGDFDNNGFDDIYVCQPAGLPNRLYRNRGDGTFEDVTEKSGLDVLDSTACALFADFRNEGLQDLLVVCGGGPLLFQNQGNGKFSLKRDAFKFSRSPQGTFTHAAIADYDHDGRLDVYFCLYSYYLGLDQYHYPAPYFDARNGPPNFLFHNKGNGTFEDRTEAAGLNAENDRYSFSCAWGDSNSDGWPDLYVANDFGRGNLYRNNGDGTFAPVSSEANVQDPGAGMSACWLDSNNDGNQDIYVANMWSAAGLRVSEQARFHDKDPERIRAQYQRHARGNFLYRNLGNGTFENVGGPTGVEMGRWAWSSDSWDFDHDGHADLYVANGYISGANALDLSSFFWRQVVAKSPPDASSSPKYERGWNAINELIRTDASWSGEERNVFYANNGDGTFSDVSGAIGLDFPEDSRAFVLADIDRDGRLEIILKNRNAPQLRILHNGMKEIGNAIAFRLRGDKSNRDGIGTSITVEAGEHRQTKYLQAGSGFLSQHTKELFFGVGNTEGNIKATLRWPSGLSQTFAALPVNHRIEIAEGSAEFGAKSFSTSPASFTQTGEPPQVEPLPSTAETWLIDPLSAPQFSLPDIHDKVWELRSFQGKSLFLNFWQLSSEPSKAQLRILAGREIQLESRALAVVAVNVDASADLNQAREFAAGRKFSFPVLFATEEVAGIYNIIYRYIYDRHRDLPIPVSFLVNADGMIVKVYQGIVSSDRILEDVRVASSGTGDNVHKTLPFPGTLYQSTFQRNDFTYGVAFFQHGYLDQAAESFKQVIARKPDDAEANYNLGTLYLRRNKLADARQYLEQSVKLRPNYPEAWNNLGMLSAQEGHTEQAVDNFKKSLSLRPDYAVAMVNLGNLYRREKSFAESEGLLNQALGIEPENPEVNYSVGMLYAQQSQMERAEQFLQKAVTLRPDYADALNNLGVLLVREQRYADAQSRFETCVQLVPDFDQAYMNLARLYVIMSDTSKAKEVLLSLLRRHPEHQGARQALDMLH